MTDALQDVKVDSVHMGIDLPKAYKGSGVIIGLPEVGIDFTHPTFYDEICDITYALRGVRGEGPML